MKWLAYLSAFMTTRYRRFQTREALLAYQERYIKKHLTYVERFSPFFKQGIDLTQVSMDKSFMMAHFDALNTVGIKKADAFNLAIDSERSRHFSPTINSISVGLSSGTSGHRGIFLTSPEEQATWAGTILAKLLPRKPLLGHQLAFFLRANNNLYEQVNSPFLTLHYYDMSQAITSHLDSLNQLQPSILVAPASVLCQLASFQETGDLTIAPQKIISVAEVLEVKDRDYIASVFKQDIIHQIYQATEGFLGYTCDQGRIHLNEDGIRFEKEYIDDKRFYPIITDFKRKSQPFLRYRLNDILVDSQEECPCGSVLQVIEKIEGRSDDIFYFETEQDETISIYPDFIRRCLLFIDGVREYQVSQLSKQVLEIATNELTEKQQAEIISEFQNLFKTYHIKPVTLTFTPYQLQKDQKLKRICQKMPISEQHLGDYYEKIND
ncbi:F390 synthetase-related protein [Streptococcus hillyeri]|uniref:CoF synthetase n=1 Tax=Streptococcus hillyeri TaxID=2282420 RepID=A0A3L9DWB2_9STRE|nr:F390 synthetase-related protein [Streptococcus hillyeri]RLY05395.1 CoF synthetase [Streptococcus hillyeri]